MSDEITIASTSDSPDQIKAAMDYGIAQPNPDEVLSSEEEGVVVEPPVEAATVVEAPVEEPVTEEKPAEEPVAQVETTKKEPVVAKEDDDELGARAKKRIDRLTWEREEARRTADAAQARVVELEAAAAKKSEVPAAKPTTVDVAAIDTEFRKTNPEPNQDDSTDYDTFVKTWTKWEMDRRESISVAKAEAAGRAAAQDVLDTSAKKAAEAAEAAEQTAARALFEERKEEAKTRYEDFDTVMAAATDLPLSGVMSYVIMDSAVGHDIAYWLATHKDEAKELAKLDGPAAIREMGRLERDVELAVAASAAEVPAKPAAAAPPVKKVTKVAAPITPVGGRGVTAKVDLNDPNIPFPEYKARRDAEDLARKKARR